MAERKTAVLKEFRSLPKVELHRHLEGSLRLKTMVEVAEQHGISVPPDVFRLSDMVQMQEQQGYSFKTFLSKFDTLRLFYRSPEIIHRITREAIEDAARDNVRYMELRFNPVALSRAERFPLHDVLDWVVAAARGATADFGIMVQLITSVNRHESPELAEQVAWLAAEHRSDGVAGIDLAGNEAEFKAEPFYGIFREARQAGLHVTIHAGEWGPAANVQEAIEKLGAERIGHGVRIAEDPLLMAEACERGTPFEVCVTSNYQSGVVPSLEAHPLAQMLECGLNVTLNTDDPSVSRITLSHEYHLFCRELHFPEDLLNQRIVAAGEAAFLPDSERAELVSKLKNELKL